MIQASGRWNRFNGLRIAADLRSHLALWQTAIFTRQPRIPTGSADTELRHRVDMIAMGNKSKEDINLDRLFIIPKPGQQQSLEDLVRDWLATEMKWVSRGEGARIATRNQRQFQDFKADEPRFLLSLWWE